MSDSHEEVKKDIYLIRDAYNFQFQQLQNGGSPEDVQYQTFVSVYRDETSQDFYIEGNLIHSSHLKNLSIKFDRDQRFENKPDVYIGMSDFRIEYPLDDGYKIINQSSRDDNIINGTKQYIGQKWMETPDGRKVDLSFMGDFIWDDPISSSCGSWEQCTKNNNIKYAKMKALARKYMNNEEDIAHFEKYLRITRYEIAHNYNAVQGNIAGDNAADIKTVTENYTSSTAISPNNNEAIKNSIKDNKALLNQYIQNYGSRYQ